MTKGEFGLFIIVCETVFNDLPGHVPLSVNIMYSRLSGWQTIHACVGNTPHTSSPPNALIHYNIPKTAAGIAADCNT